MDSQTIKSQEKPGLMTRLWNATLWKYKYGSIRVENLPMLLWHLTPVAAFFVEFNWSLVGLAVILYATRMFAITGFYHRYFSHRGFKVNRVVQFLMGLWGTTATQQGPIWWAAHHRHHHKYSDQLEDLHSPKLMGFWQSHIGWIFSMRDNKEYLAKEHRYVQELLRYPELVWLDKYYMLGPIALGLVLFAMGGLPWLVWGMGVSTVALWHGTFTINSLSHVIGSQRFETGDTSRNNWFLAIVTLGEGWHNNHHYFAGGSKAGFYWYEYDITYYGLWLMHKFGLIRELGQPPHKVIEEGFERDRLRKEARGFVHGSVLGRLNTNELQLLTTGIKENMSHKVRKQLRKLNTNEIKLLLGKFDQVGEDFSRLIAGLIPAQAIA